MIPKLTSNPLFVEDYKRYQQRILAITDINLQKELTDSLVRLKEQVSYVDRDHEQILLTGKMPGDITERRTTIGLIKKNLDQRLVDWESAQMVTPAPRPNEE